MEVSVCFILFRRLEHLRAGSESIENALSPPSFLDIWDDKLWYSQDASRHEAQALLKDKPEGTFLVRYVKHTSTIEKYF
jgi:hypothetical protein